MSDTVIKVEGLGKLYKLGEIGTGTLSHDLNRWWARVRGKEDPFAKIGDSKNTFLENGKDYIWALKDINFEVRQGEVLGIIGRNGAGKSTLLKILSKVTTPTTGRIKIKGRVASLLEVGTGFHPELTGQENIFLNGAILGMTKVEIKNKFDQIVDFAGVERYIGTPVKRYSSGMYVRLAFAVAAHLESEILIVDEVLAVGDAEFQKKCLGKMEDVSKREGRTVFFVSHNMESILKFCTVSMLLEEGQLQNWGETGKVIDYYLQNFLNTKDQQAWDQDKAPSDNHVRLNKVYLHDTENSVKARFEVTEPIGITFEYEVLEDGLVFTHGINIYNDKGVNIFNSHDVNTEIRKQKRSKGKYKATVWIPENLLTEGIFIVGIALFSPNPLYILIHEKEVLAFETIDSMVRISARGDYSGSGFGGVVRPLLTWDVIQIK